MKTFAWMILAIFGSGLLIACPALGGIVGIGAAFFLLFVAYDS